MRHNQRCGATVVPHRWAFAATALSLLALTFLAGCTTPPDETVTNSTAPGEAPLFATVEEGYAYAVANEYALMASILVDNTVSREDYERAFYANLDCFEKTGYTFAGEVEWNPIDNLQLYVAGDAPQSEPTVEQTAQRLECSNQFEFISYTFQTETTPVMDAPLLAAVTACLEDDGIPLTAGATNLLDLVGEDASSSTHFNAINDCVISNLKRLYPDLPGYSIAF